MRNKKLFTPLALIFCALFFVNNAAKAQGVRIKWNAPAATGWPWYDPGDQNWVVVFYEVNTSQTYSIVTDPTEFNNGDNWETGTLLTIPNGEYQITFWYQNQVGEERNIYHDIALDYDVSYDNDFCPTSTSTAYAWPTTFTLDDSVSSTLTIYTHKDY